AHRPATYGAPQAIGTATARASATAGTPKTRRSSTGRHHRLTARKAVVVPSSGPTRPSRRGRGTLAARLSAELMRNMAVTRRAWPVPTKHQPHSENSPFRKTFSAATAITRSPPYEEPANLAAIQSRTKSRL